MHRPEFAPRVVILKPHGSLGWHIIGGVPCSVPGFSPDNSMIITPGLNKYKEGYNVPFDGHREYANKVIDSADRYVIIGYGFNDHHLETHLVQQIERGKSTLLLTYSLSSNAANLVNTNPHVLALTYGGKNKTSVVFNSEQFLLDDMSLWDIEGLILEVF